MRVRTRWSRWARDRRTTDLDEDLEDGNDEDDEDDDGNHERRLEELSEDLQRRLDAACRSGGTDEDVVPFYARCLVLAERLLRETDTVTSECCTMTDFDAVLSRQVLFPWTSEHSTEIYRRVSTLWRFLVVFGTLPAMPVGCCPDVGYRCFVCRKEQTDEECHHLVTTVAGESTEEEEVVRQVAPPVFPRLDARPSTKQDVVQRDEFEIARRVDRRARSAAEKLRAEIEKEIRYAEACVRYASLPKTVSLGCISHVAKLVSFGKRRRQLASVERETFDHRNLGRWTRNLLESMLANPDRRDQRRAATASFFRLVVDPTSVVTDASTTRHETAFRTWMEACEVPAESVCEYVDGLKGVTLKTDILDDLTGLYKCLLTWHVFFAMPVSGGSTSRVINRSDVDGLPDEDGLCFLYDDRRFLVRRGGRIMTFVYERALESCVAWIYHGPLPMTSVAVTNVLFHTGFDDDGHEIGEQ